MRPKSFFPCRAPLGNDSWLAGTPSDNDVARTGMFQINQCVQVPAGASGSSAISASVRAWPGTSLQLKAGEMFSPAQVYLRGISPPFGNALDFTANATSQTSLSRSIHPHALLRHNHAAPQGRPQSSQKRTAAN